MIDREGVKERIARIMKQAGITQQELAAHLGISQPAVSLYLQGRMPPPEVLLHIAQLGNTTVEWLLTGQESAPGGAAAVKEPAAVYLPHRRLLNLWQALPPAIRQDLLRLMQHLVDERKEITGEG